MLAFCQYDHTRLVQDAIDIAFLSIFLVGHILIVQVLLPRQLSELILGVKDSGELDVGVVDLVHGLDGAVMVVMRLFRGDWVVP